MSDTMACFDIIVEGIQPGSPKTTTRHTLTNLLIMLITFIILYNVNQVGVWGVGLATKRCNVNAVPLGQDSDSWVVNHDAVMYHNKEQKGTMSQSLNEGDTLGITYDHVHLNFYLNGQPMNCPFSGMKGTVFPVFYVDEGAVLDVQFDHFYHQPPDGFDSIMIEQSLL
ncbi:SPRY domain-containing protein 7 [Mytilus edulis]|uniref:SPRY domain-containing protein 7 n=1 Tax=Mytilus edulis TaxID=6550 RepID=A0A8S3TFI8_MYTED|nr:SPRY domain-containing protein 7 [Mytilus edulis]